MTTRWSHSAVSLCCLLLVVCILAPSLAQGVDGNAWLQLPADVRGLYLLGVLDGWLYVQSAGAVYRKRHPGATPGIIENTLGEVINCHKGKTYMQLSSIVRTYMNDHPESRHNEIANTVFVALSEPCFK